ncbi:hypothetical protein [Aquidulcibacter sp.]|uniref:hypothetical protein n=1 Tax=Aquidulcibacter sp. TaxID=2052990 RepID=UPI0025C1A334|nr:hypothetical protein [Aquidulcibacter sp.]MCA3693748.1 hypothetical protein [Aquidulcibacter sp.]
MTMHARSFGGPNTTGVRSLAALAKTCSTSRVLNLNSIDHKGLRAADKLHTPLFQDRLLNSAIITKHRPRPDEVDFFHESVPVATKIIFPLDNDDLRVGGRSVFVNQIGYLNAICDFLGKDLVALDGDLMVLELLNELPSLDPFLVREQLKRHSLTPSDDYFAITPNDTARLEKFAYNEIRDLVSLAFQSGAEAGGELVKRMSNAILATNADHRLAPLQATLGLEGEQFQRGIFSWKGFLYYKWQFVETKPELYKVVAQMQSMRIRGRIDPTMGYMVTTIRGSIKARIQEAIRRTADILSLYDDGLAGLTQKGNAVEFRKFLLEAPGLFIELGHAMGMISHIVSYWRYQFKPTQSEVTNVEEFIELLKDFDLGLSPREVR